MASSLREWVVSAVASEPVLSLARALRGNGITSLMYHEVLPDAEGVDAWTVVDESSFREQMRYLAGNFEVVSLDEALRRLAPGAGGRRPLAIVTFDDGYRGNKEVVWPIVEELRIPITVFVATSFVQDGQPYWYDRLIAAFSPGRRLQVDLRDRGCGTYAINAQADAQARWTEKQRLLSDLKRLSPDAREVATRAALSQCEAASGGIEPLKAMTIQDIREMACSPLVTFGAHSHCHNILTQLPADEIRTSLMTSRRLLETWTKSEVRHFAYPNGDYDAKVTAIVQECGFVTAQTTAPGLWRRAASPLAIPRIGVGRYDSPASFRMRVARPF